MTPFTQAVLPKDVGRLIDLTVIGDEKSQSMANLQLEGIAALHNILSKHSFAYLADEVGMGKTYQALGLAALLWNEKPEARILFISPRQNLQIKWIADYHRFFSSNFRRQHQHGDDRVTSVLFGEPLHRAELFHNLRSWTPYIGIHERIAPFIRHTSFTRPVFLTSNDFDNLKKLRERIARRFTEWGLFDFEIPKKLSADTASQTLNRAFAEALSAKLTKEGKTQPYFDLVIVDEAQCLRNITNQTNTVLFESLKNNVANWLFMSATPAHSGPGDLPTILNHYPGCGEVLDPKLADDLSALQSALEPFIVRRQREYETTPPVGRTRKSEYRNHESGRWGISDQDMSALATLSIGLVQKGLVSLLQGRSNRYRIGFLSSFESLSSSIGRALPPPKSESDEQDVPQDNDWHHDRSDPVTDSEALDTDFIRRLSKNFEKEFKLPLRHPKVHAVVERVAPAAFGSKEKIGGEKFLIFTRRVSTVETLRKHLDAAYHQAIEERVRRCWKEKLDWSGRRHTVGSEDPGETEEDSEDIDSGPGESRFRAAMARKGWLGLYRNTFRRSGRNALFFEDGWLQRLSEAGGRKPADAARDLPDELWAESWTHAASASGNRQRQNASDRVRYLAVQGVRRYPQAFGLDKSSAAPWQDAFAEILHAHLKREKPAPEPEPNLELFTQPTLWTEWDKGFSSGGMALPAASATHVETAEDLYRRQVARTILGQVFRLTDTILDLYFANRQASATSQGLPAAFLDWLMSEDPGSRQIRNDCENWLAHLRLIVDSCLAGAGKPWRELAQKEHWEELFHPSAVMGVTGSSGAHSRATLQFRTPSLPRVIVCTDTLKEGVDLHTFCDRVIHYGVAWTSGDLEQRVGRVDRYFSKIERRLREGPPPDVQLHVGYPHVVASLEKEQVQRVIDRQKEAEKLMDSPLAGAVNESKELVVSAPARRTEIPNLTPYDIKRKFPVKGRDLTKVSRQTVKESVQYYANWFADVIKALKASDWEMTGEQTGLVRNVTMTRKDPEQNTRGHDLEWSYDSALDRNILTVTNLDWPVGREFSGGTRRRLHKNTYVVQDYLRLIVPKPDEEGESQLIEHLISTLNGGIPEPDSKAATRWGNALDAIADGEVTWQNGHRAEIVVKRDQRAHRVAVYAYEHGVRIVGVVALLRHLELREAWNGPPTTENLRNWTLEINNKLPLGYLDVHPRDGLIFGVHALHGELSDLFRGRLVQEVAWRADAWEAALTNADRW